ncbi:hypothetical protein O6H91_14G015900 [Diphasiastrum complanatum]|uniref:Uncharacterized protein n=1 Tax=Diphasiastrum complanatum TaxID=34168 RepID=A0ACC2BLT1_DIPCM|nr:hypothetical protein O6H91_14G015900 [Diphasiastrum complanatum]
MLSRLLAGSGLLRSKHLNNVGAVIILKPCSLNATAAIPFSSQFCTPSIWQHASSQRQSYFCKHSWAVPLGSSLAIASARYWALAGKRSMKSELELFLRNKQLLRAMFSWRHLSTRNAGGFRLSTFRPHSRSGSFANPEAVLWGLISLNLAVYLLWRFGDYSFMHKHFMVSVDNLMSGRLHTVLTSAFSHKDIYHLLFNMLGLYFFGREIALGFGGRRLLLLYLAGGVAGSLGHVVYCCYVLPWLKGVPRSFYYSRYSLPALGASGAVNAIVVFDILLNPRRVILIDFLFPVPAIFFGTYLVLKDLWGATRVNSETAHAGHLGGALVGAAAWMRLRSRWR